MSDQEPPQPYTEDSLRGIRSAWTAQRKCDEEEERIVGVPTENMLRSGVILNLLATIEAKDNEIVTLKLINSENAPIRYEMGGTTFFAPPVLVESVMKDVEILKLKEENAKLNKKLTSSIAATEERCMRAYDPVFVSLKDERDRYRQALEEIADARVYLPEYIPSSVETHFRKLAHRALLPDQQSQ